MKDTLLPYFKMLPAWMQELKFHSLARRYMYVFVAFVIADIIGLTISQLALIAFLFGALCYLGYYLTQPETPAAPAATPASPSASPDAVAPQP